MQGGGKEDAIELISLLRGQIFVAHQWYGQRMTQREAPLWCSLQTACPWRHHQGRTCYRPVDAPPPQPQCGTDIEISTLFQCGLSCGDTWPGRRGGGGGSEGVRGAVEWGRVGVGREWVECVRGVVEWGRGMDTQFCHMHSVHVVYATKCTCMPALTKTSPWSLRPPYTVILTLSFSELQTLS